MQVTAWIIPWYREQDWADWCSICKFTGSHKDWVALAQAGAKQQEALGRNIAKVIIEPGKFRDWSSVNGGKFDHQARTLYAISIFDNRESASH